MKLLAIIVFMLVLVPRVAATDTSQVLYIQIDNVNVRSGPGADFKTVMQVDRGQKLLERNRQGEWVKVWIYKSSGKAGWVHSSLVGPAAPKGISTAPSGGSLTTSATTSRAQLSFKQEKELMVFGMRAGLRINVTTKDVKNRVSPAELNQMIALGLNGNDLLCANVVGVHALRMNGKYEVECIAYRGGSGTKTYVVDALNGIAFEE